mmetsp:Transcript_5257/g.10919  ORF Transcript_5257/g.10919 Transcript_5257/m.10919 type:complete len:119 (-) Transcript_5257:130-486(-)
MEDSHPLDFIAEDCTCQMLAHPEAPVKTVPLLKKLVPLLRLCFDSKEQKIYKKGLKVLIALSNCCRQYLDDSLGFLLSLINKKCFDKTLKENINECLATLERNGGKTILKIIKSKIPT